MQGRNNHAIQLHDRMEGSLKKDDGGSVCSPLPSGGSYCFKHLSLWDSVRTGTLPGPDLGMWKVQRLYHWSLFWRTTTSHLWACWEDKLWMHSHPQLKDSGWHSWDTDTLSNRSSEESRAEVFNRGSATPRGSAEVLQGDRDIFGSLLHFLYLEKKRKFPQICSHKLHIVATD